VSVSADSAATVRTDYNAFGTTAPRFAYTWAGTDHATAADLASAVPGQAAHDLDVSGSPTATAPPTEGSPLIDSGDADAPGTTALDYAGDPRSADDPNTPDTGAGSGSVDRGAYELQSVMGVTPSYAPAGANCVVPCDLAVAAHPTDSWRKAISAQVDFGDGAPAEPLTTTGVSHHYANAGPYTATVTATNADGQVVRVTQPVTVATVDTPRPQMTIQADPDNYAPGSVDTSFSVGSEAWELARWSYNWGDGSPDTWSTTYDGGTLSHHYTAPGPHTVTLTTTDVLGRTSTATATLIVGDDMLPQQPARVYDTRTSGHQSIPAHGTLALPASLFYDASAHIAHAVCLTTTVTGATAGGYLTVYPDGATRPTASTLNFGAHQTVPNTVVAAPGSDGKIAFYNGSGASVDLVVDTFGLEVGSSSSGSSEPGYRYTAVGPTRILDTRNGTGATEGAVAGKHELTFTATGAHGVPANAKAVVMNIAGTDTAASGYLGVYGHGTAYPGTSDSNWAAGQTVSNLVTVPVTDGKVVLHNGSAGSADFVADVVGYYRDFSAASAVVPTAQTRVLDTRTGAGTGGRIAEIPAHGTIRLTLAGRNDVPPTGATAAALNLTVTHQTKSGYVTAYPDGTTRPAASALNFGATGSTADAALVPVGTDGSIDLYNGSTAPIDLVADQSGYYYTYPTA